MINKYITQLIDYAEKYLELLPRDKAYATNRIMDALSLYEYKREEYDVLPELPDQILKNIYACLERQGVEFESATLAEKLMDAVILKPSEYEKVFFIGLQHFMPNLMPKQSKQNKYGRTTIFGHNQLPFSYP